MDYKRHRYTVSFTHTDFLYKITIKRGMDPFRGPIFCIIFFLGVGHSDLIMDYFIHRFEMDNKIYTNGFLRTVPTRTRLDCMSECSSDADCHMVLYSSIWRLCSLYDHQYTGSGMDNETDSQFGWECWGVFNCGPATVYPGMESVTDTMTYQGETTYTCSDGYTRKGGNGISVCQEDGSWSSHTLECQPVDCGPPDIHTNNGYAVQYTHTTYMSMANVQCGLGRYSIAGGQSMCQKDRQWSSVSLTCLSIPTLVGTTALASSNGYDPVCRTVKGGPILSTGNLAVPCDADEILIGCSSETDAADRQIQGTFIGRSKCYANGQGASGVARCCKIPRIQCEYIRSAARTSSISCYKNFQLLDCSCTRWPAGAGQCPTTRTNTSCEPDPSVEAWRYATCCLYEDFFCYMKSKTGQDIDGSGHLTITCEPGELMVACSGFNTDKSVHIATITETNGVEECKIHPGTGSISTLVGYVSCCRNTNQ